MRGTAIGTPSGFDIVLGTEAQTELRQPFDLAFDIDAEGQALIFPTSALRLPSDAGVRQTDRSFEDLDRAPTEDYQVNSPIVVEQGTVFLGRSRRATTLCTFLGAVSRFGKFRVLELDREARTITMEFLVNANCGFRSLEPGIPRS